MPKLKTVNKPKNLKKRRRDNAEEGADDDESKKVKMAEEDAQIEYVGNLRC